MNSAKARPQPKQVDTYDVVRRDQLEAVVSMRRHDIVDQVSSAGPMSVKEIAAAIGVAPSSLYYHVEYLVSVGLLVEAGVQNLSTKAEQLYTTPGRRMSMLGALQDTRNWRVMTKIVDALCKQARLDFAGASKAAHAERAGARRNMRFFRLVGRPDKATLERINSHLDAVTELMTRSARGAGPRISLMWVEAPLQDIDED